MNAFVPPEYWSFDDAIDRVAEIAMLARDPGSLLTQDEKGVLQGMRARKAWAISQGRPGVTPASYPEPPRLEIIKEEFKKIMDKEAAMKEQRLLAKEELQKLLYTEQIPSVAIEENGSCYPAPGYIWGGKQWSEALSYDRVTFPYGSGGSYVSGRPIIPKDALEAAFDPDGTPRSTVEASSAQEASMPRHRYRTRLLDIMEEIWSDIDASDWEASPPKKVSVETDLQNRFELTKREAGMIATMFIPDNRRGKTKKG